MFHRIGLVWVDQPCFNGKKQATDRSPRWPSLVESLFESPSFPCSANDTSCVLYPLGSWNEDQGGCLCYVGLALERPSSNNGRRSSRFLQVLLPLMATSPWLDPFLSPSMDQMRWGWVHPSHLEREETPREGHPWVRPNGLIRAARAALRAARAALRGELRSLSECVPKVVEDQGGA